MRPRIRRTMIAAIAAGAGLGVAGTAGAATSGAGLGSPFATAALTCPASPGSAVGTGHATTVARIALDRATPPWSGSLDIGAPTGLLTGLAGGDVLWWSGPSLARGETPAPALPCAPGDPDVTGIVEYFDPPGTPLTFSDPAATAAFQVLGFRAVTTASYIADVSVTSAYFSLWNPDWKPGGGDGDPSHDWHVDYQAPNGATVSVAVPLGRLTAGAHTVPFGFDGSSGSRNFSLTIRQAVTPAAPAADPPAAAPAPPAPVAVIAAPPSAPVVGTSTPTAVAPVPFTVKRAKAALRTAVGKGLKAWKIRVLRCRAKGKSTANCDFTARRGTRNARGVAAVRADGPAGLALRITVRLTSATCKKGATGCTRVVSWAAAA